MEKPERANVETHSLHWREILLLPFLWDRATQLNYTQSSGSSLVELTLAEETFMSIEHTENFGQLKLTW